ncbi:hypothetical protein [Brevibacterium aurantiacum]|uniref:Uncharacterized protein n=1 Tax=Brevibacterium aurantiacum TaxID=273384 RepID=A0A2H1KMX6_BREAU|nr:hypothetical protein [Brevibacterium aurantiacum]SMY01090.1 hypothetical protein BAUR920_03376 [Brevibacterium aurantiacum]
MPENHEAPVRTVSERDGRIDGLVACIAIASAVVLVGMLVDIPGLIFCMVPVLVGLFMYLSSHKNGETSKKVTWVIISYTFVMLVLFALMYFGQSGSGTFGGLPISMGILLYIAWPFSAISAGLLYAWVYRTWLSRNVDGPRLAVATGEE